jgi:hypothetical protein
VFIFFSPLFASQNEKSSLSFSMWKVSPVLLPQDYHHQIQCLTFWNWRPAFHCTRMCFNPHSVNTDRQLIVSLSFPVHEVAPNKVEFSKQLHTKLWGGLCCCGRINETYNHLCIRIWKLVVRLIKWDILKRCM